MRVALVLVLHTIVLSLCSSEDRSKWADPSDMINFDHASKRMLNKKPLGSEEAPDVEAEIVQCDVPTECPQCPKCDCEGERSGERSDCPPCSPLQECVCEQAALPLLRKYTQNLLSHLEHQMPEHHTAEYTIHISLSEDRIKIFQKFVETGDQRHVHDVHYILTKMINRVAVSRLGTLEKLAQAFEYKIGMSFDRLIQFLSVAALASIVLLIEVKLQIAWRRRVSQLIVLMFVISIPWTWYDLYKEAEIKQESRISSTKPTDCDPGMEGYWKAFKSVFTFQEDKCLLYYESLMVDPLIKVPPTKAIAVTFVRFFLAPLKDVGTAISEFLRALLVDLPVTLYPVALGMICFFLFITMLFWSRYRVHLPFYLLTIEPSAPVAISSGSVHQAVTDANQQTLTQLEQLQSTLLTAQNQLTDKLQHLEKVQQLAIEHSQSFGPPSPADSPTIQRLEPASAAEAPTLLRRALSIPAKLLTPPSLAPSSDAHTLGSTTETASSARETNESGNETANDVASKDKMSQGEEEKETGLRDPKGKGDPGAGPNCASVSRCVDTLLPDGIIDARSST